MNRSVLRRLACLLLTSVSAAVAGGPPEIAYVQEGALHLVTRDGAVVSVVRAGVSIGTFTIAPDLSRVVFVPLGSSYGGPLYLLTLNDGRLRKLSRGLYWPPLPKVTDREVYADPEFSPDGNSVVFAIRDIPRSGGTDMVEASGPLAVMDVKTGVVQLLRSTLNVQGQGPAFANGPQWSPDGTRILVSFETGFAVVSADGKDLRVAEPPLPSQYDWSTALGWLGDSCILFGVGHNGVVERSEILHLSTAKTEGGSPRLGFALGAQHGLETVWASGKLLAVGTGAETSLFDVATRQLLKRFPPGAKLLRAQAPSVAGCE